LSFELEKYREKLKEYIDQIMNGKDVPFTAARSESEKVVKEAQEKAESLLQDVEDLIGQIKTKSV
jgi:vacuolar-type H+-ATPase subunit H